MVDGRAPTRKLETPDRYTAERIRFLRTVEPADNHPQGHPPVP